mmetsp:Transcript_30843/g.99481  ORF Transcript_30843/g.99481 Transcript_30843/m.99481 type:complete len:277 (+) Transcript_30843:869-1699(+)
MEARRLANSSRSSLPSPLWSSSSKTDWSSSREKDSPMERMKAWSSWRVISPEWSSSRMSNIMFWMGEWWVPSFWWRASASSCWLMIHEAKDWKLIVSPKAWMDFWIALTDVPGSLTAKPSFFKKSSISSREMVPSPSSSKTRNKASCSRCCSGDKEAILALISCCFFFFNSSFASFLLVASSVAFFWIFALMPSSCFKVSLGIAKSTVPSFTATTSADRFGFGCCKTDSPIIPPSAISPRICGCFRDPKEIDSDSFSTKYIIVASSSSLATNSSRP